MPTEPELLAARIARIKALIEAVEKECASSAEASENFMKLKRELDACSAALKSAF